MKFISRSLTLIAAFIANTGADLIKDHGNCSDSLCGNGKSCCCGRACFDGKFRRFENSVDVDESDATTAYLITIISTYNSFLGDISSQE